MTEISENPVLNPTARLRFQEIEPDIPERTIPELPSPPPEPEVSSEEDDSQPAPNRTRDSTAKRPAGRHRRVAIPAPPKDEEDKPPAPPKIRPPDFREWHDFGANFIFKWLCRAYVGYVFRGIDRERILNAAELKALEPDADMLSSATKPFAHMADRSKFMKKHGRAIIDSADGIEALIAVGMYANTIRRIARSHEDQRTPSTGKKTKNVRVQSEPVREQPSGENVSKPPRIRVVDTGESGFGSTGFGIGG